MASFSFIGVVLLCNRNELSIFESVFLCACNLHSLPKHNWRQERNKDNINMLIEHIQC